VGLQACPDCGHRISDRAMFCVQCGCPLGPEQANHPQAIQNALSAATEDIAIQQTDLRAFSSSRLPLFPVATHKFIVLSICTLGIYELYWCYQNWKRIKAASRPHQARDFVHFGELSSHRFGDFHFSGESDLWLYHQEFR